MPLSDRCTQYDLLKAIISRLIEKIDGLGDMNCFICDQRTPLMWPSDRQCVVVSVGNGRFPEAFYSGGGALTLCEQTTVEVTAWVRVNLDSLPELASAIYGEGTGLYSTWKPDILRALLVSEDAAGAIIAWNPLGPGGKTMLRNQIAPIDCSPIRQDETGEWSGLTVTFGVDFDWLL